MHAQVKWQFNDSQRVSTTDNRPCNALAAHCNKIQYTATYDAHMTCLLHSLHDRQKTLQRTAAHYSTPQRTAARYNIRRSCDKSSSQPSLHDRQQTLQRTVAHCNIRRSCDEFSTRQSWHTYNRGLLAWEAREHEDTRECERPSKRKGMRVVAAVEAYILYMYIYMYIYILYAICIMQYIHIYTQTYI